MLYRGVAYLPPGIGELIEGLLDDRAHVVVQLFEKVWSRAAETLIKRRGVSDLLRRFWAPEDVEYEPRVGNAAGQWADVVEAKSQRLHSSHRDFPERRFQPNQSAGGRGNTNRASGVGANGRYRHACCDRNGRATAGATRRPFLVKRMKCGAEGRAFAGSAERALVQVTFSDDDGAGST